MLRSTLRACCHEVRRRVAEDLNASVLAGSFSCEYAGSLFGAFPRSRVFVENLVDVQGLLAPFPKDPRLFAPVASRDVLVAACPSGHRLAGELRCVARHALQPGAVIPYAGQVIKDRSAHHDYSSTYSCNAAAGRVVDASRFCNEAAFVNHYHGLASEPNCRLDDSADVIAAVRVVRPMREGEELLVDYGMQYCLRNNVPHERTPDWAHDLAAMARLMETSSRITSLESQVVAAQQRWERSPSGTSSERRREEVAALHEEAKQIWMVAGLMPREMAGEDNAATAASAAKVASNVLMGGLSEAGSSQVEDLRLSDLSKRLFSLGEEAEEGMN